jgi:hypothetical protein
VTVPGLTSLHPKNHATVLVACKRIEELLKKNAELHWQGHTGNKVCKTRTILAQLEDRSLVADVVWGLPNILN